MKQLTTKESSIYKNYIFEQIVEKFKNVGTINIEYLKKVITIHYEISDITHLIYPSIEFEKSFKKLKTLSNIELNKQPNDLFDHYTIKTIKTPTLYIHSRHEKILTPYDNITNFKKYLKKYLNSIQPYLLRAMHFTYEELTILTNGDQKEFNFIDKNQKNKQYLLPINDENNKSLDLYEHYRDIKQQLQTIVNNIKPLDNQQLYDLVINHYNNI